MMVKDEADRRAWSVFGSRRAAIGGYPATIVAIIVLFVIFFFIFIVFRIGASNEQRAVEDVRDVSRGNYLAQLYLRLPVDVGDQELTMAELLAIYDHQQGGGDMGDEDGSDEEIGFIDTIWNLVAGEPSVMRDSIVEITNEFVREYYPEDKCYFFGIHGNHFDINVRNSACSAGQIDAGIHYYLSALSNIPVEHYSTLVAPVSPADDPIVVYSVYDFERLLQVYGGRSPSTIGMRAVPAMCQDYPDAPQCVALHAQS